MGRLNFLHLPREIRDIIYRFYVLEDDGYQFDYESGKLRASNRPVNLALMYTNRLINSEMHGLALGSNTIWFSTVSSESERLKMGKWHWLLIELSAARERPTSRFAFNFPEAERFHTPEVSSKRYQKYPESLVEPNSEDREDSLYYLKLLAEHPEFVETIAEESDPDRQDFIRSPIFLSSFDPWMIPSEDEVAVLEKYFRVNSDDDEPKDFWKRIRYRWSAAAVAIRFLQCLSTVTRLQIRNIVLNEDRESVAYPECHCLGLIPFCLENSQLRITRNLNLWRNILPANSLKLYRVVHERRRGNGDNMLDNLIPGDVSIAFSSWMMEHLLLFTKGAPSYSFSLIFDGSPTPERSSEVFEAVKRSAAYQTAWDQIEPKPQPNTFLYTGPDLYHWYTFGAFPQALKDMIEGKSSISCNFFLGGMFDAHEILEQNRNLIDDEWQDKYDRKDNQLYYQTAPPLPPWKDLRLEDVIPEE